MTFLALDTSGDYAVLALAEEEGAVRAVNIFEGRRSLSRRLMGEIDRLLHSSQLTLDDLSALAVGLGPGSFTGVRVGVTTARTLAQVTGKPLVGVGTLHAYAAVWQREDSAVVLAPVLPSRRGEGYAALYRGQQLLEGPFATPLAELQARLRHWQQSEVVIACGAAGLLETGAIPCLTQPWTPPDGLARLAAQKLRAGQLDDPLALLPLYVVPPSISTPKDPTVLPGSANNA